MAILLLSAVDVPLPSCPSPDRPVRRIHVYDVIEGDWCVSWAPGDDTSDYGS